MSQEDLDRYFNAAHAMQSGVAAWRNIDDSETNPKHLRVGVNSAMVNNLAVATLLIEKGVFTEEEYEHALAIAMEKEVEGYETRLRHHHNTDNIHLR